MQQSIEHLRRLCNVTEDQVWRLKSDSVAEVKTVINNTVRAAEFKGPYTERQSPYMIKLKGENRWRRVYATPIGNVSVYYFKHSNRAILSGIIMCETALDEALNNV